MSRIEPKKICACLGLLLMSTVSGLAQGGSAAQHYVYVAYTQHVEYFNGGSWQDVTVTTGAPAASPTSQITGFGDSLGEHVFFLAPTQHMYQLYYAYSAGSWLGAEDLTVGTGGTLAASGSSLTAFADSPGEHLVYLGTNNHVYQLFYSFGTHTWGNSDLTAITGGVAAASGSALTSFPDTFGEHIFFLGTNQHVYQLYYAASSKSWLGVEDLTAGTGNTLATLGSALSSFSDGLGEHAVYIGTNHHVYQLFYSFGTHNWGNQDLTTAGGGPTAASGSGLTSFYDPAGQYHGPGGEHVFYISSGTLYELLYNGSSWVSENISYGTNGYPSANQLASTPGRESNPPDYEDVIFWSGGVLGEQEFIPLARPPWIFNNLNYQGYVASEPNTPVWAFINP